MTVYLDALQAAAEAATPGEWQLTDFNEGMSPPRPLWGVINDEYLNPSGDDEAALVEVEIHVGDKADAEFIAAANPAVILELLDKYREVERHRDDLESRLADYLCESTGGQLSKTGYDVRTMVQHTEAYFEKLHAATLAEAESAHRAALARIARVEALHARMHTFGNDEFGAFKRELRRALTEGEASE